MTFVGFLVLALDREFDEPTFPSFSIVFPSYSTFQTTVYFLKIFSGTGIPKDRLKPSDSPVSICSPTSFSEVILPLPSLIDNFFNKTGLANSLVKDKEAWWTLFPITMLRLKFETKASWGVLKTAFTSILSVIFIVWGFSYFSGASSGPTGPVFPPGPIGPAGIATKK